MDAEAWLAANTFQCDRLSARLTSAQCAENKAKSTEARHDVGPLYLCRSCLGVGETTRLERRRRGRPAQNGSANPASPWHNNPRRLPLKEEEMAEKPVRKCVKCGKDKPIIGRDMCGTCYRKAKEAGEFTPFDGVSPELAANVAATVESVLTDADRELLAAPASVVAVPSPPHSVDPLEQLLTPSGVFVELDPDLAEQVSHHNISHQDINQLLRYLIAGELKRVKKAA